MAWTARDKEKISGGQENNVRGRAEWKDNVIADLA